MSPKSTVEITATCSSGRGLIPFFTSLLGADSLAASKSFTAVDVLLHAESEVVNRSATKSQAAFSMCFGIAININPRDFISSVPSPCSLCLRCECLRNVCSPQRHREHGECTEEEVQNCLRLSSRIVTGPSFTSSTCIRLRKLPQATSSTSWLTRSMKYSYNGFAVSGAAASIHEGRRPRRTSP